MQVALREHMQCSVWLRSRKVISVSTNLAVLLLLQTSLLRVCFPVHVPRAVVSLGACIFTCIELIELLSMASSVGVLTR